jgi:hypothetical protein
MIDSNILLDIKLEAKRIQMIDKILSTQKDPEILRSEIEKLSNEELLELFENCKIVFGNFRNY